MTKNQLILTCGRRITISVADMTKNQLASANIEVIKYFEPASIRDSLKVEEIKVLEQKHKQPKGLYHITDYNCYDE